jgi:hypothetical protein
MAPPEYVQVIDMAKGHYVSMIVHAAARFALADHLASGPKTAAELAGPTNTHAPSLYRLMRTLASLGLLTEDSTHRFHLTSLGAALKTGAPGSARATILTIAGDWFWHGLEQFPYSVQTGKSGFEKTFGMPVFDYLAQNPEKASLFSETMIGIHGQEPAAVAEVYDFSDVGVLMDVGGASGNLAHHGSRAPPGTPRHPLRPAACRDGRKTPHRGSRPLGSDRDPGRELLRERSLRSRHRTCSPTSSTTGVRSSASPSSDTSGG